MYDDTHQLLVMAVADKALYGIETLQDLRQVKIPVGEQNMILPWKESAQNLPILRQATIEKGVTEQPWAKSTFEKIFKTVAKQSGYVEAPTVHAIRRAVGKMIDERYSPAQRSQHLTQKDLSVFGNSYVANTSSVDGKSAFLNEPARHDHIDYFQSFERFRENRLPTKLPAHLERAVKHNAQLAALRKDLCMLKKDCASSSQLKTAQNRMNSLIHTIRQKTLVQYQDDWIQQQRQLKVQTHGHLGLHNVGKADLLETMSRIFPGRDRLAQSMTSRGDASSDVRWRTMQDLYDLITKDYSTIYLPGEEPKHRQCPFVKCAFDLSCLPKDQRSTHVHACHREDMAIKLQRDVNDIKYCYLCFTWSTEEDWNEHCRLHLSLISSKRCGSIIYCNTFLRPYFCPLCIGDVNLDWSLRLKSWVKADKLRRHLKVHLAAAKLPVICTHPLCQSEHETQRSFSDHLKDDHAISFQLSESPQQPHSSNEHEFVECKRYKRIQCDDILGDSEINYTIPQNRPDVPLTIAPLMLAKKFPDESNTVALDSLIERSSILEYEEVQQDGLGHNELSQADDDTLLSTYLDADYLETPITPLVESTQGDIKTVGLFNDAPVPDVDNDLFSRTEQQKAESIETSSPTKKPRIILRVRPQSEALKEKQVVGEKRLRTTTKRTKTKRSRLNAKSAPHNARLRCIKSTIPKIRLRFK